MVLEDGSLWEWGAKCGTRLAGNAAPKKILSDIVSVSTSGEASFDESTPEVWTHTLAVAKDGSLYGWGFNGFGQMYGLNVIIVAVLAVAMYFYLKSTKHGFEIAVVGESHDTARYAAINVPAVTVRTVTLSGAVCGIAGFLAVAGQGHTISTNTAGGRGYVAIIVAWLAKFNTLVMILVSFLIVFLEMGAREIASKFNISDNLSQVSTGIILFFILGSEFFINYKVALREKDGAKQSAE